MWNYEKRLQFPVNIKKPDARAAKVIISQYGGPDGELSASMRYLSQRFSMTNRIAMGTLNDIGISVSKLRTLFFNKRLFQNFCFEIFSFSRSPDFQPNSYGNTFQPYIQNTSPMNFYIIQHFLI